MLIDGTNVSGAIIPLLKKSSKPAGKLYQPQHGQIIHGDCIDIMSRLIPEMFKVIVTSPPYNLKNSSGNGMKDGRGGKWPNADLQNGYAHHEDDMPHHEYVEWQRDCLSAMMRVLREDGAIFYNHKWRVQNGLLQDRQDIVEGFPVRQIIIWQRSGGINFNPGYFLPNYEVKYLICKPKFKLAKKANALGCVWNIHQENKTHTLHHSPFSWQNGVFHQSMMVMCLILLWEAVPLELQPKN